MTKVLLRTIEGVSRWLDCVANTIAALLDSLASPHLMKLIENEDGEFQIQPNEQVLGSISHNDRIRISELSGDSATSNALPTALRGSRVELVLRPTRFLFRPLELPARAAEFLDGIVRAQIDRLTPWNPADAAFGWTNPVQLEADRLVITIAAAPLALIAPHVNAIRNAAPHSIAVFTTYAEAGTEPAPVKVLEEKAQARMDIARIRRALTVILMISGLAAAALIGASAFVGASLDVLQEDLAQQIAKARAQTGTMRNAETGSALAAQRTLVQRKHAMPPSVLLIETLSQILPDDTYVLELHIENDKVQMVGVTRDAPSLIGLMEQSTRFSKATFFAPTTRSTTDSGERFHIEAQVSTSCCIHP